MTVSFRRFPRVGAWALVGILLGCGKAPEEKRASPGPAPEKTAAKPVQARPVSRSVENQAPTFAQATTPEPPANVHRPPDKTLAGKNVPYMYEQIAGPDGKGGLWNQIPFVSPDGKALHYTVTLTTDLGDITIELWPDIAPNHVRNFLALIKVGYYDGLTFHRAVRSEYQDEKKKIQVFEFLEAGCPLGTGEPGYGSIGYWLWPELHDPDTNPKVRHQEGTVGAWHEEELETAACKFYITLSTVPSWDGNYTVFGKVTGGLDVARRILARPALSAEEPDRPRDPVIIRRAAIQTSFADAPPTQGK